MPSSKIDNRKDVLLLLLWSPGISPSSNEPIVGRTRLVKALFLFSKEVLPHFTRGTGISESNFYNFFPWNFGPFSTQVYDDLTFFMLRGFVQAQKSTEEVSIENREEWEKYLSEAELETEQSVTEGEYQDEEYLLTRRGVEWVEANLVSKLSSNQKVLLSTFKSKMQAPLRAILRYTYETYPAYTDKSIIKDKVLGLA